MPAIPLEPPRMESGKPLLIAGLRRGYTGATMNDIPTQWQQFGAHIGKIQGQVGRAVYGLCLRSPGGAAGIDYLTGVEVTSSADVPAGLVSVQVPAQRYAVFTHREHISRLRETLDAIWSKWAPESGLEVARAAGDVPEFFERYTESFDPRTGMGGVELWIPLKK